MIAARAAESPTLNAEAAISCSWRKQENPVDALLAAADAQGTQDHTGDSDEHENGAAEGAEPAQNPESFCDKLTKVFSSKVTGPQTMGEEIILPLKAEFEKEWRSLCKVCWRLTSVPRAVEPA